MTADTSRSGFPQGQRINLGLFPAEFSDLPERIRMELLAGADLCNLSRGEALLEDGDSPDFVGCVVSGVLCMVKLIPDGRSHIIGVLKAGDFIGGLDEGQACYQIAALTEAQVMCFSRSRFAMALQHAPEFERRLMAGVMDDLGAAREWLLLLGVPKIASRVAAFLLILHRHTREDEGDATRRPVVLNVPFRRSDLAQYLGTRAETLSRAFHQLQAHKAIRIRDANTFELTDLARLIDIAGHDLSTTES